MVGFFKKSLLVTLILITALLSTSTIWADSDFTKDKNTYTQKIVRVAPVIFESNITVTEKGGKFVIGNKGFVTFDFPKTFIDKEKLPMDFDVQVMMNNGDLGAQVEPSMDDFLKPVTIMVKKYNGLLYDIGLGKNVKADIDPFKTQTTHFCWFKFR